MRLLCLLVVAALALSACDMVQVYQAQIDQATEGAGIPIKDGFLSCGNRSTAPNTSGCSSWRSRTTTVVSPWHPRMRRSTCSAA